jgi:hypothetical protein
MPRIGRSGCTGLHYQLRLDNKIGDWDQTAEAFGACWARSWTTSTI